MIDLLIDETGDWIVDQSGNLELTGYTPTVATLGRTLGQMAFIGMKTDKTDFLLHPVIGNELERMIGLPNNEETADFGRRLITSALKSIGIESAISIEAWPEDYNVLAFEITIAIPRSDKSLVITARQEL